MNHVHFETVNCLVATLIYIFAAYNYVLNGFDDAARLTYIFMCV